MQSHQNCAICQRQPQELLILACHHNLCLPCASQIFILNDNVNPFICQICLSETQLDLETISHFQVETQRNIRKQGKKQIKNCMPPKIKSSPQKKIQTLKNYCQLHKQLALYFCLDCNSMDICSQCILTPKHTTHKVLTLKKALQNWQRQIQEQIKCNLSGKHLLEQQKETYIQGRKQSQKLFNNKKLQVKQIFDEIARAVSERYAELSATIEEQCLRVEQLYDACLCEIDQKQRIIDETVKIQREMLQSKAQYSLSQIMTTFTDSKNLFISNLPNEMPTCFIQLLNSDNVIFEISQLLSQIKLMKEFDDKSINESIIKTEDISDEHPKTTLKQSYRKNNNQYKIQNRLTSSRKLDLSRSIQNATYIINRLQERSAKVI